MAFNINAQVILSGPKNIRAVTKRIKSELSSVSVPVNIKLDRNISKNLGNFNRGVKELTTNLNLLRSSATGADASIRKLVAGLGTLSSINTKVAASHTQVAASVQKSGKAFQEASSELREFGKDAALAIRRFTAFTVATGVVFGFVRAVQKATGAALDFEREIVRVVQVTGASSGKINQLKKTISDLSVSLGVDANELANLGRVFAQTGQTIDQVRASIRAVARSSLAPSFGQMKGTAEGLIAAMAQFNIQAGKSEQVLGALNAVSKRFAVESDDLISVIRRAGGVFSVAAGQMKEPQEALNELIGLFTAVRSTTRESADTIATGLRTIFTRIQRRGTIEFLRQFNIELLDAQGKFVGLFPAFQRLSKGLRGLVTSGDAVKLSAVTEELGGIRQVGKLIPALTNFNKALAATKIAAKGAAEGLGKDVNLALQPLGKQFDRVAERFNNLIRTISESKTFQNLAKVAISTANAFLSVAEALTPLIPLITTFATIKITKGLFEFGQGFVGGLRKGKGVQGAGGAVGTFVAGGGSGGAKGGAAAGRPTAGDKALTREIRNNIAAVRANTAALNNVRSVIKQSSLGLTASATNIVTSNTNLIAAIGNLTLAISRQGLGGGLRRGGFRPPKFARGGVVRGPSHAQGGVLAELEGGEAVIPRRYVVGSPRGVQPLGPQPLRRMRQASRTRSRIARDRGDRRFGGETGKEGVGRMTNAQVKGLQKDIQQDIAEFEALENQDIDDVYAGAFLTSPSKGTGRQPVLRGTLDKGAVIKKLNQPGVAPIYANLRKLKGAMSGTQRRNATALITKLNDIEQIAQKRSDYKFVPGVLGRKDGRDIENIIVGGVERAVTKGATKLGSLTGATGPVQPGSREMSKILRSANIDNVIGNMFEAIISGSGVPYSVKDNDAANAPFDFPVGLKGRAPSFGLQKVATRPTDAKTRYTSDNLRTFITKVQANIAEDLEEDLFKAFGDSGKDSALILGTPRRNEFKTTAIAKVQERRAKKGLKGVQMRAAGGPIFTPRGTDTVPAMLTPGEYVINRESAKKIGYSRLDNMNRLAKGGPVRYYNTGGGVQKSSRTQYLVDGTPRGSTGAASNVPGADKLQGATSGLIDKIGLATVAFTGLTTSLAAVDFSSLQSAIASLGSFALTFAQLQFFLPGGTGNITQGLKGILGKLPGAGARQTALEAGRAAFRRTPTTGRAVFAGGMGQFNVQTSKTLKGFQGFLAKSTNGLKAFSTSIGSVSKLLTGLPGLIVSLIAGPIIDSITNTISTNIGGALEELAPGISGRRGLSANQAGGIAAAGGAAKGALTGAALGTFVGLTGPGAVLGAAIGGFVEFFNAQSQQRLFNTFLEIQTAGKGLAKSFELIEKSGGLLGRDDQRQFEQRTEAFNLGLFKATKGLRQLSGSSGFTGVGFDKGFRELFFGRKSLFEEGALNFGEGQGLQTLEELRKVFRESGKDIALQSKALTLNLDSLFGRLVGGEGALGNIQKIEAAFQAARPGLQPLEEPLQLREGAGFFDRLQQNLSDAIVPRGTATESVGQLTRPTPGPPGIGLLNAIRGAVVDTFAGGFGTTADLTAERAFDPVQDADAAIKAFSNMNKVLKDIGENGGGAAGALKETFDSFKKAQDAKLFIDIMDDFNRQAQVLQRIDTAEGTEQLDAFSSGMGKLLKKTGGLRKLSTVTDLKDTLDEIENELVTEGKATPEQAKLLRELIGARAGEAVAATNQRAELLKVTVLQRQATKSTRLFSLELKNLADAFTNTTEDFSIFIGNLKTSASEITGGTVGRSDVLGRFTGSDAQFKQLEQGGAPAKQLRTLSQVQAKLPGLIAQVVREQQALVTAGGAKPTADQLFDELKDKITADPALGGNVPQAALDQIRVALSGARRQEGMGATADALLTWTTILANSGDDIAQLSGILQQADDVTKNAFESLKKSLTSLGDAFDIRTQIENSNIQRRIQFRDRFQGAEDRVRSLRGGRQQATREEAQTRVNRRVSELLGRGGRLRPGGERVGLLRRGQGLLEQRRRLRRGRRTLEAEQVGATGAAQVDVTSRLAKNAAALERTNKALDLLTNENTLLTAALSSLEEAINKQTAAEASIGTLADLAGGLARGEVDPFSVRDTFTTPIRAFNKLEQLALGPGGVRGVQAGGGNVFAFEEAQALRKALESGSPLLNAQLKDLADRIAAQPGQRLDSGQILRSLRSDLTTLVGRSSVQFLRGRGLHTEANFLQRNLDLQQAQQVGGIPAAAAEVDAILREQRELVRLLGLSNQELFGVQLAQAAINFKTASDTFKDAVRNFEARVAAGGGAVGARPPIAAAINPIQPLPAGQGLLEFLRGLIPSLKTGGHVRGPSHAQGGVLAELEGGEFVIPKKTVQAMQSGGEVISDQQVIRKYSMFANKFREQTGHSVATNPIPMFVGHGSAGRWIKPHTNKDGSIGYSVIDKPQGVAKKTLRISSIQGKTHLGKPLSDEQPDYILIREGQGYQTFVNEMATALVDPDLRRGVVGPISPERRKRLEHRNKALEDFRRYEALREKGYQNNAIERLQARAWGYRTISRDVQQNKRMKDIELYSDLLSLALTSEHGAFPGVAGLMPTTWSGSGRDASAYRNPKVGNRRSGMRHERRVLSPEPPPLLGPVTQREQLEWNLFGPNHPGTQHLRHKFLSHAGQVPFETGSLFDELSRHPSPGAGNLLDSIRKNLIESLGEDAQGFAGGGVVYAQPGKFVKGKRGKALTALQKFWAQLKGEKAMRPLGPGFGREGATGMRDPLHLVDELTAKARAGRGGLHKVTAGSVIDPKFAGGHGQFNIQTAIHRNEGASIDAMVMAFAERQFKKDMERGVAARQVSFWTNWLRGQDIGWEVFGRERTRQTAGMLSQMQRDLGVDPRDATDVLDLANIEAAGTGGGALPGWPHPRATLNKGTLRRVHRASENPNKVVASQQYLKALVYEEFLHNIDNLMGLKLGGGPSRPGRRAPYASAGTERSPGGMLKAALNVKQRGPHAWSPLSPRQHPFAAIADMVGPEEQKRLALISAGKRGSFRLGKTSHGQATRARGKVAQKDLELMKNPSKWLAHEYGAQYYASTTERFAKMGSIREAYGPEAIQYILGKEKAELFEELWKKSKVEMATYLNTMKPAAPKLPGGKTASENILGRARGGMVYAKDGWFGFGRKGKKAADKDLFAEPTGLAGIWAKIIGAKPRPKGGAGVPKFDPPTVAPRPVTRAGQTPDLMRTPEQKRMSAWMAGEDVDLPEGVGFSDALEFEDAADLANWQQTQEKMTQAREVLEEQLWNRYIQEAHSRGMRIEDADMALLPSKFDEMINKSLLQKGYSAEDVDHNWKQTQRFREIRAKHQSRDNVKLAATRLNIRARDLPAKGGLEGMGTVGEAEKEMFKRYGIMKDYRSPTGYRKIPTVDEMNLSEAEREHFEWLGLGQHTFNETSAAEQSLRRARGLTPEHFTTPGLFKDDPRFSGVKLSPKAQSIIDAMELNWGAYPPYLPEHKDISKWKDLPPALGLRRGGPVYAQDGLGIGWYAEDITPSVGLAAIESMLDAGPLGKPNPPYDDPFPQPTVRTAGMGRYQIMSALRSGNASKEQYNEAWRLARSSNPEDYPREFFKALHAYDMAKQIYIGKGRVLESAHLGLDPMSPFRKWKDKEGKEHERWTHRRLWDHKGNRLVEGIDPQTGLMKGDVWLRIEARRKAVESQSLFQDYVPEMFYWKKDFPSYLEDIPYTVEGQRQFEHMVSPGSMNKFGKAFNYLSGDPIIGTGLHMLEGGEMMIMGIQGGIRGALGAKGTLPGEDPTGQQVQIENLKKKWMKDNPAPADPRRHRHTGPVDVRRIAYDVWLAKREKAFGEIDKLWPARTRSRIWDDTLRGMESGMYDPSWAEMGIGFMSPYNRGGLVYASKGSKGFDLIPSGGGGRAGKKAGSKFWDWVTGRKRIGDAEKSPIPEGLVQPANPATFTTETGFTYNALGQVVKRGQDKASQKQLLKLGKRDAKDKAYMEWMKQHDPAGLFNWEHITDRSFQEQIMAGWLPHPDESYDFAQKLLSVKASEDMRKISSEGVKASRAGVVGQLEGLMHEGSWDQVYLPQLMSDVKERVGLEPKQFLGGIFVQEPSSGRWVAKGDWLKQAGADISDVANPSLGGHGPQIMLPGELIDAGTGSAHQERMRQIAARVVTFEEFLHGLDAMARQAQVAGRLGRPTDLTAGVNIPGLGTLKMGRGDTLMSQVGHSQRWTKRSGAHRDLADALENPGAVIGEVDLPEGSRNYFAEIAELLTRGRTGSGLDPDKLGAERLQQQLVNMAGDRESTAAAVRLQGVHEALVAELGAARVRPDVPLATVDPYAKTKKKKFLPGLIRRKEPTGLGLAGGGGRSERMALVDESARRSSQFGMDIAHIQENPEAFAKLVATYEGFGGATDKRAVQLMQHILGEEGAMIFHEAWDLGLKKQLEGLSGKSFEDMAKTFAGSAGASSYPGYKTGGLVHAQGGGLFRQIPEIGGGREPRADERHVPILEKRIEDLKLLLSAEKFFGTDLIGSHLKGPGLQSHGITAKGRRKALLTGPDLESDFMRRMAEIERIEERRLHIEKLLRDNERILRQADDLLGRPYAPALPRDIGPEYKQDGGSVFGNRHIFKPKGTDTIPAMLSPGEFVVRRDAVNAVGVDTLRNINSMGGGNGAMTARRGGMVYAQGGGPVPFPGAPPGNPVNALQRLMNDPLWKQLQEDAHFRLPVHGPNSFQPGFDKVADSWEPAGEESTYGPRVPRMVVDAIKDSGNTRREEMQRMLQKAFQKPKPKRTISDLFSRGGMVYAQGGGGMGGMGGMGGFRIDENNRVVDKDGNVVYDPRISPWEQLSGIQRLDQRGGQFASGTTLAPQARGEMPAAPSRTGFHTGPSHPSSPFIGRPGAMQPLPSSTSGGPLPLLPSGRAPLLSNMMGWDIRSRGRRDRIAALSKPELDLLDRLVGPQNTVRNIDTLSEEEFEGMMKKVMQKFRPQAKPLTPAQKMAASDKKFRDMNLARNNAWSEMVRLFGDWAYEAGLFSAGDEIFDTETIPGRTIKQDPNKIVAAWVKKWGGPPISKALKNRDLALYKEQDEKTHGRGVGPKADFGPREYEGPPTTSGFRRVDPLFAGYGVDEDTGRFRIKDRAPEGRRKFGSTGRLRGAGTVIRNPAHRRLSNEERARGKVPGGMTTGRFDAISATRAEKARREAAKAQARTAASNRRVKKQRERVALDKLRQELGLPGGASRDEILAADQNRLFLLRRRAHGENRNLVTDVRHHGATPLAPQEGIRRLAQHEIDKANSDLYPKDPLTGQAKKAGGGKFIDITKLGGYQDLVGEDPSEFTKDGIYSPQAGYVDAFGQPGGPGIYVGRDAWATAHARAELERAKRPRYRKSGNRVIRIRSTEEKKEDRQRVTQRMKAERDRLLDLNPNQAATLKPHQQRQRDRALAGRERARARNAKRLAGINKIRAKRGLAPITVFDHYGVPVIGWEAAMAPPVEPGAATGGMSEEAKKWEAGFDHWDRAHSTGNVNEKNRGGLIHAQGGGLFRQIPEISGGFVRGARTTLSNREKRLTPSSTRNPGGFGRILGPRKGGWFLPNTRSRIGRQLSGERGTRYNVSEAQRKEMLAAQKKYVWDSIHARDAREREERRSGKSQPPMLGEGGLQRIGPLEFPKDSSGKRSFSIRGGKGLMEIIGAMGSVMRQKWEMESPAEKTGRMGLGHSGGYGGMQDPRWGMGGADYMHMKERRALDLHGYQRGGPVRSRQPGHRPNDRFDKPLRMPPPFPGSFPKRDPHFFPSPTGVFSAMGNIMRRKWGMESPAEKTGRLGFGHTTGYGGMKDPRWGMGGADYMYTKERGKGFHGYNRGGNVDSVLGALTPGEFVMRREAVRKYGERFMNDINLQKLNQGGSVGAPAGGGGNGISQAKDLERGAALAGESILNAFTQGSQMVGDAIREALAPENLAAQIGDAVSQKMQESLAATSIEMKGNMGVDVRLSGNGATGDMSKNMSETIKNAIAGALNSRTNSDGSAKDPSLHQPQV